MSFQFEWAPTADRSTLEAYAKCPKSARLTAEHCPSAGVMAAIGNEVHDAIANTIIDYIAAAGDERVTWMNPPELLHILKGHLLRARPDVQPEVMEAMAPSLWAWCNAIHPFAPWSIMRHDGGEGERSGQLTEDVETSLGTVQATSEIDFLAATPVPQIVVAKDWKTGWKQWAEGDVEKAFQMQMLAWLVLSNYPEADAVDFSVWNTRTRRETYPVRFTRERMDQYAARISEAAEIWMKYRTAPIESVPAWPARGKCEFCDASAFCDVADVDINGTAKDPNQWLQVLWAAEHKVKQIKGLLSAVVENTGRDVTAPGGLCFGVNKPKANRKPTCDVYEVG